MKKLLLIPILLVAIIFPAMNIQAANKIIPIAHTTTHVDHIFYDVANHTYYAATWDATGRFWALEIAKVDKYTSDTQKSLSQRYNGDTAYVDYDTNGGSSNDEDWTVLNWWTAQDVD